ncbi:hypothetical protein G7K_2097-t1 [Saitoella complicata NRRL Y-17804]|uniref:ABC transporter domain-containing protein n=1 Tax=Saitoella complicata (strain BCRC 22490 / CBS 7301 / JCM 7358 / NBRC 10748 / NRRL Y-17804) TaxID=698492 RepID=A0A0E9NDX6_SAICN|nr:hypothetical protein G7K_2097-t1 [Saitoella complicata NRRL Y-17804]
MQAYVAHQTVNSFVWDNVSYNVKDKLILDNISGCVKRGEYIFCRIEIHRLTSESGSLMAIMGPSGCGKTSLLNILSARVKGSSVSGEVFADSTTKPVCRFVEQEDNLIGVLTVRETLMFAAKLDLPKSVTRKEREELVDGLIKIFGLEDVRNVKIGTAIQKGISGGQKRRVSIASQLISLPPVVFLDEPTSGLDSEAAFCVMRDMRKMAQQFNMIIIATVHQPSTVVFNLFDDLLLLSKGKTVYCGKREESEDFFAAHDVVIAVHANLAEVYLSVIDTDFAVDKGAAERRLNNLTNSWKGYVNSLSIPSSTKDDTTLIVHSVSSPSTPTEANDSEVVPTRRGPSFLYILWVLCHRSTLNAMRNMLAYWLRVVMYMALGVVMGTTFFHPPLTQERFPDRYHAMYFGMCFASFMSVAGVPAFLEERAVFCRERANGQYGVLHFSVANALVSSPFVLLVILGYTLVMYWGVQLKETASGFLIFLLFNWLNFLAAEAQVVFVSSMMPNFVIALTQVAFLNGLWMVLAGLVSRPLLPKFWKYTFANLDYQRYVWETLAVNEFGGREFECTPTPAGCVCQYADALNAHCKWSGDTYLESLQYGNVKIWEWFAVLISIIIIFRSLAAVALFYRRK